MKNLNKIEKQYAAAMLNDMEAPNFNDPELWPIIRGSIKRTAYHEAGHFAARLFTQLEFSHTTEISILGNSEVAGYVRSERSYAESSLESCPPPIKRSRGRMLLIQKLAGCGAEMLLDKSEEWNNIFEYYDCVYGDEEYNEGSDFYRVLKIAEIMAKSFMPVNRILKLADKWTLEMLAIPEIWNIVETVAGKLINQGKIKTNDCQKLLEMAYDSNFPDMYALTKWKRRIFPKEGELDKYIERT